MMHTNMSSSMTRHENDWRRYCELREQFLDAYPHGSVSPELESLILGDPERKRDFVSHLHLRAAMAVCGSLKTQSVPVVPPTVNPMLIDPAEPRVVERSDASGWGFPSRAFLWGASVMAVAVWFALVTLEIKSSTTPIDLPIAVIRAADHCQWGESSLPTTAGSDLFAGRMRLISGTARLDMKNTSLTLQGPVDIELINQKRCKLHRGSVLMESSNGADGLVIIVPNGAIANFGAEIGIHVSETGNAELHVFSGMVKAKHCALGKSLEASESEDIEIQHDAIRKLHKEPQLIDSKEPIARSQAPGGCNCRQLRVSTATVHS